MYKDIFAKFNGRSSWVTPEMTLGNYIGVFAPKKDKNDPVTYTNHMVKKLNEALGIAEIDKNTPLSVIKQKLEDKGLDSEHVITTAHMSIERPDVLTDLKSNPF